MNPQTRQDLEKIYHLQKQLGQLINNLEPTRASLPPGLFRELTTAEDSLENAIGKLDSSNGRNPR